MGLRFEIKHRDCMGKICSLGTPHGIVTTPTILPVINPNKLSITPKQMEQEFGAQMIITNSYIIRQSEHLREKALSKGVHALVDFPGPIMTDSGAFQAYVYRDRPDADIRVTPAQIVEFQRDIGVDVGTALDIITDKRASRKDAEKDVDETIGRIREAVTLKGDMALAGTVQGSVYPALRERCARTLAEMDIDLHPIGGVVPLMEEYRYSDLAQVIIYAKKGLPPSRPVHLFGAGHPHLMSLAVLLGCDLFDSSSYMKYALGERMMFNDATRRLEDLEHLPCNCPICVSTDVKELRAVDKAARTDMIARHNLHVLFGKIRSIRQAIYEERLWEMVERDLRNHPYLLKALKVLEDEVDLFERFEVTSRMTAFMHTGPESRHRPIVKRYRDRLLKRYTLPRSRAQYVLPAAKKPYNESYQQVLTTMKTHGFHFCVESYFGPVPIELDLMYPLAQSLSGPILEGEKKELNEIWARLEEVNGITFERWSKDIAASKGPWASKGSKDPKYNLDLFDLRVKAVASMQFGQKVADAILDGDISIVRSRTGKIRNVHVNGDHVLSVRAYDGMYTLKMAGAKRILEKTKAPLSRVIAKEDAAPFILEGKNLFSKFVVDCDPDLRPGDEVVITGLDDRPLAVGRLIMNREEMLSFDVGVAVRTREHF